MWNKIIKLCFIFWTAGTTYYGYSVIGNHSDLMSSGACLDSKEDGLATACPWDSRVNGQFFHQTTFTIPIENVKEFISDIQTLVKIEPKALYGLNLYNGVLIRYVQPSFAYMGNEFEGIEFEFTYTEAETHWFLECTKTFLRRSSRWVCSSMAGYHIGVRIETLHLSMLLRSTQTQLCSWRWSRCSILYDYFRANGRSQFWAWEATLLLIRKAVRWRDCASVQNMCIFHLAEVISVDVERFIRPRTYVAVCDWYFLF